MNARKTNCIAYYWKARKKYCGPKSGGNTYFFAEALRDIWTAFDAYIGWKFPDKHNNAMQQKYAVHYQNMFKNWQKSDLFNESIKHLKTLAPVKDMSPIKPGRDATLQNHEDLKELIYLLYRIRSNLDHGAMDLESDRNKQLTEYAFNITYEILEKTLNEQKIIQ